MSEPILISALVSDVIDDSFFDVAAPTADASARLMLKNRIYVSQRLLRSGYIVTGSITTRLSIAGQVYILYVSLT
jgi:hypothetical protein